MNGGWIKLHRKMSQWEWYKDSNTKALFLHLLLEANHEDKKYKGIVIHKGETMTGLQKLSDETGLSVHQVRTALEHLKLTHDVAINVSSKGSIIRVVNYDKYQCLDNDSGTQSGTICGKRVATNKNNKNIRNIYIELPTYDSSKNIQIPTSEANELLKLMGKEKYDN